MIASRDLAARRSLPATRRWFGVLRRMVPAVLIVMTVAIGIAATHTAGQAQESLRIVAVVNDEPISAHDLAQRIELLLVTSNIPRTPENRRRIVGHVLTLLIEERLKLQEARRLNVSVSRSELDAALKQIASQVGVPLDDLPTILEREGVGLQALIDQVEAELAWIKAVQARARGRVAIDDEEIDAYLDRLARDAGKTEYRVAEIFLPVDDPSKQQEVQELAHRLIRQLSEGASFRALARNFSQGASAAIGGDLGWLRLDQFDPELQPVIPQLATGQAFGPVRTALGFHIIYMIDQRVIQPPGHGAVEVTLYQLVLPLPANADNNQVAQVMDDARSLAAGAHSCEELAEAAERAGASLSGELGTVQLNQLDKPLRELVTPLAVGEPSQPTLARSGVAVFMVCDRKEVAVDDQLREQVRKKLLNERLDAEARRMLRDLKREAFVDVRIQ